MQSFIESEQLIDCMFCFYLSMEISVQDCIYSLQNYLTMNNPYPADLTFGVPHSERGMNIDHGQLNPYETDIQRQMRLNPPSMQPYQLQQRRNQMNQIIAYDLINKGTFAGQPNYPSINQPQTQFSMQNQPNQPNFNNQLPPMIVPALINATIPINDFCPQCQAVTATIYKQEQGMATRKWCCILSFVCLCFVPYLVDQCLDLHEICYNCHFVKRINPASFQVL